MRSTSQAGITVGLTIANLVEERGQLHLVEDVAAVVARRLVGAERHQPAAGAEMLRRRHDAVNNADAAGAETIEAPL